MATHGQVMCDTDAIVSPATGSGFASAAAALLRRLPLFQLPLLGLSVFLHGLCAAVGQRRMNPHPQRPLVAAAAGS